MTSRITRLLTLLSLAGPPSAHAVAGLGLDQIVELAFQANPQLRAAEWRWRSAEHSVVQSYAPADPVVTYTNLDSPTNGLTRPAAESVQMTEALQFPGKAILQARNARRSAEIARLVYEAARRDLRAEVEVAFYQLLLDQALGDLAAENVVSLKRVRAVTQVAYSTGRVTQLDFISAQLDLAAMEQQRRDLEVSRHVDRANLNRALGRDADEPLDVEGRIDVAPIEPRLEPLTDAASRSRQEILEAALAADSADTALSLAKLEYAPDLTLGYVFTHYRLLSDAPDNVHRDTYGLSAGVTVPLFFWVKQREDVERARFDLQAAKSDLASVRQQAASEVSELYWQADAAYRAALLYRDSLAPLARQAFEVAVVGYEAGKVEFVGLAGSLRRWSDARVSYLQAANRFLAQKIALEQAIGAPLSH